MVKPKLKYYFVFLGVLFFNGFFLVKISTATSPDAIAVRVIQNPNHYSALRWYRESGFTGSPQSITVDGYEAVRDGRTVYVNAGNVQGGRLYTNIYLLSFSQAADNKTMDIFSSLLAHWKFNTNLDSGNCSQTASTGCLLDSECPLNEYCLSEKAEVVRDTNRMAGLGEINVKLASYNSKKNYYPTLRSGTYLPHITISVWPSWQKVLGQELSGGIPVDPINKLGDCGDSRFNSITCWDEVVRQFADSNPANGTLDLPANSMVFVYTTDDTGSSYSLCAPMESAYADYAETGICAN